jgi:hypothetical protein
LKRRLFIGLISFAFALFLCFVNTGSANAAFVFHSGFENGNTFEWASVTGLPASSTTQKKTGAYSLRCNPSAATAYVDNGLTDGNMDRGSFWLYIADDTDTDCRIIGNGVGAALYLTTTEEIDYYTGGTKRSDGTLQIALTTWTRISWATDGSTFKVFINGVQDISNAATVDEVADGTVGICTSATADLYFDNVAVDNTSSTTDLGDIRVLLSLPDATGASSNFDTPVGSANHWDNVNEIPTNDADYNEHDGSGQVRDTYNLQNCTTIGISNYDTINAVRVFARMKTSASASTAGITVYDPTSYYNYVRSTTTTITWFSQYLATRPSTGGIWSVTTFNNFQAGAISTGTTRDTFIYDVMVMVAYTPIPAVSNDPSSKAFGTVTDSTTYYAKGTEPHNPVVDDDCTFTITNSSSVAIDLAISATNFTGGVGWTLGVPAQNVARMTAYYSGQNPASGVVLTTSGQAFYSNLATSATKKWDFKLETPTAFTDGVAKTSTITLTATVH